MSPTPRKKVSPALLPRPTELRALARAQRAPETAYAAVMRAVGLALVVAPLGLVAACATTHEARPPGGMAPIDPVPLGGAAPPIQPVPVPSGSTSANSTSDGQTPPCPHGQGHSTT